MKKPTQDQILNGNRFKYEPKPVNVNPEIHNILLDRVFLSFCLVLLLLAIWVGVKPLFV